MRARVEPALLVAVVATCLIAGAAAAMDPVDLSATPKVEAGDATPSKGTDAKAVEREAESMSSPVFQRKAREGSQEFKFEAEVSRLMDIIIHSLYSNKDIFLRELISNASDALDKIRFLSLTDKSVLGDGDNAKLEIKIWLDPASKVLYIRDRGVGMTRDELVKNLGTIARSGTSAFLESMQKGGDMSLIGQFGVGFYSVYLVADWVEVVTKANGDKQWIWSSDATGSFSVAEDGGENEPLGRGTLIKIHLKPEALEYAEEAKLRELVAKYSEFINFPIYMQTEKEVDVPVESEAGKAAEEESEDEEEEADAEADKDAAKDGDDDDVVDDDDDEDEEDDEGKKDDKKPETRKEKVKAWDLLNDVKAIWLRSPSDVPDDEYQKFYKSLSKDYDDALGWVHFKAEGDVEFRALAYIPKRAPYGFWDRFYERKRDGLRLYVRRVFISDEVEDLLPRWLSFIRGLVDSDSLPLNVSREMLQAHSSLKTVRKKLVRKVLDYIKKLADDEAKCKADEDKADGKDKADDKDKDKDKDKADDKKEDKKPECSRYSDFWREFGKAIKLGVVEDAANRARLAKLLRFTTSKSPDTPTSLDEYVARMPEGQKQIYWVSAPTQAEAAKSPFLEGLVAKGYEVIYMTDVLDEYVMGQLTEYDDRKLANVSKDDVRLDDDNGDDDKDGKKDGKSKKKDADKEAVAPLLKWWKEKLAGKVTAVRASSRLASTPCVVVASKFGQTANMERIMRAQALSDGGGMAAYMRGQRALEVNPRHPLVRQLLARVEADPEDPKAASAAALLFDTALLESGYLLEDAKDFAGRVYGVLAAELGEAAAGGKAGGKAADEAGEEEAGKGSSGGKDDGDNDGDGDGDDDKDGKDEL